MLCSSCPAAHFHLCTVMECSPSMRNAKCVKEHCCQAGELSFDSVRTSEWGIVWSKTRVGRISPTPKSSVALNSSVPANRLTSVAAVLKASSIPLERWMHSERWIKRWKTQKNTCTYKLSNKTIFTGVESFLFWDTKSRLYLGSWAYHKFWTRWQCRHNHMTSSSSGFHFHRWHCTPTSYSSPPLRPYSLDQRERERERSLALMQATCWTYSGLLACLTNNKGGEDMKGEVGELKVLFDFAPQSRYHGSLSTQMHTLCCICWCRAVEPKCPRWKAQYVCSVSEVTRKHFANSNKATVDPTVNLQIEIFPDTVAVDSIRLLCLWFIGLKMGSEMARNPL